jgi:hypothetical protein
MKTITATPQTITAALMYQQKDYGYNECLAENRL